MMSDQEKKPESNNVVNIDEAKIRRLKERGHVGTMIEDYEKLRLKLFYDQPMDKQEAQRFVVLCKYFMQHGPSESFRLSCEYLYKKYMEPFDL